MTRWIIEPASNGYLLTMKSFDPAQPDEVLVFEDREDDKKHIVYLLYSLLEALGEVGSKHDEERVRVIRVNREGKEIVD